MPRRRMSYPAGWLERAAATEARRVDYEKLKARKRRSRTAKLTYPPGWLEAHADEYGTPPELAEAQPVMFRRGGVAVPVRRFRLPTGRILYVAVTR